MAQLPLPYLPRSPPLSQNFLAGAAILLVGLTLYNSPVWLPPLLRRHRRGGRGDRQTLPAAQPQ